MPSNSTPNAGGRPHARDYDTTPLIVTWEVTQACDLTCDHCRAEAQPERHPDELTTSEGKTFLRDVAEFGHPSPIMVFSGGDPLKRPDLFELIDHSTSLDLPTAVTPAPTPLLDDEAIKAFDEAGVRRIALSLDGATATRHDGFRGEDGSFETILRAADHAKELGLSLQINTTVTASTVDDLPEIASLVEELGAVMWEVFFLVPIGRGADLEQLSAERTERVLEWLYRRQRDAPFRVITVEAPHYRRVAQRIECDEYGREAHVGSTGDGKGFIFVSHTGGVYPSGFLPVSIGNVREDDIISLYRDASLLRLLRDPDEFDGACGACSYRGICGGSRARAHAMIGNPLAIDSLCLHGTELNVDQ